MDRSQYIGTPGNFRPLASAPRNFRSTSGGGDDLHSRKNGVFLPSRISNSRTDLSTDKVHRSFGSSSGGSRIDPQVYTDTQSRGLTSRLASYYERERIDIKPIVNRLYNKAGDLPIVHLNKNELASGSPRHALSLNASRVRIPAPDKSTYISNMRSEILRTGSMVGHSPSSTLMLPNASDPNPDTSFEVLAPLDALKEISRKRIHCDEVNLSNSVQSLGSSVDRVKKQRAEEHYAPPQQQQQTVTKRQRDTTSPTFKQQLSTESQKKRPCTKNNDVLSSLSSSVRFAAARKNFTIPSPVKTVKPVPTIPAKVTAADKPPMDITSSDLSDKSDESLISETSKRQSLDEPPSVQRPPAPRPECPAKPTATKLTLFNQRYATYDKKTSDNTDAKNTVDDDDDSAGISFVKPRAGLSGDSAVITRRPVESSKLALMLSCLSGDLDEVDDDDQVDAIVATKVVEEPKKTGEESSVKTIPAASIPSPRVPAVSTAIAPVSEFIPLTPPKSVAAVSTVSAITTPVTTAQSTTDSAKSVASLFPTTVLPKSTSVQPTVIESKPAETQNNTFSFGSSTTLLSFGTPTTTSSTTTLNVAASKPATVPATTTSVDPPKAFSFGLTSTPASTTSVTEAPKANFSFGSSITAVVTATSTTLAVAKPAALSFGAQSSTSVPSFGSKDMATTFNPDATTQSLSKPIPDPAPAQKPALLSTPFPVTTVATTTTSAFSFGASAKPTTGGFSFKPTSPAQPTGTKPGAFTFGSSQPTQSTAVFGGTTTSAILPTPSFGATSTFGAPAASSQPSTSSTFGAPSNSIFGASTVAPPTFGDSSTTTTTAPLSFGSFNLSAPTTTASSKPGGFTFNPTPAPTPASTTSALPAQAFGSTFGATTTTSSSSTFGTPTPSFGANPAANVSSFGSTAFGSGSANTPSFGAASTTAPATPSFGATSFGAPPSFGASTTAPTFGTASGPFGGPTTTASVFGASTTPSFGSATAAAPSTTLSFGSTTPSAFGSSTPSFGGAAVSSPFGTPAGKAAPSAFGSTASSTSTNFFGSNAGASSTNPSPARPFAFGATSSAIAAPPSFGGTITGAASPFAFGGTSSPAQQPNNPSSLAPFTFNANPTQQPANSSSSPFAFGSNSTAAANPTSAFGSMASKIPVPTNPVKPFGMPDPVASTTAPPPFAFGGAPSAAPFAFGSGSGSSGTGSASTPATAGSNGGGAPGGAFNFGANLFSATPANGGTPSAVKGRPIRTATRRIFK